MRRFNYLVFVLLLITSCNKTEDINNNILRLYGDALEDIGYGIARTDEGYIISGQMTDVESNGSNGIDNANSVKRMGIIKTNINGDVVWKKMFGDQFADIGSKAVVLSDGSVICAGYSVDATTRLKDVMVVKTDNLGNEVLRKVYKAVDNQYEIGRAHV